MGLPRLPAPYRYAIVLVLCLGSMLLGVWFAWKLPGEGLVQLRPSATVKLTAQLIRSEDIMFLVTNRVVTQVMVEQKQDSVWAGVREGVLLATTRMYYGVDLAKLEDEDIHEYEDRIIVVLPAARVLDFAIDPNFKVITKRSGMNVVLDWVYGNDLEAELRSNIQTAGLKFARENDLFPSEQSVLARLNKTAMLLTQKAGKPVVFTFHKPPPATTPATQAATE